MIVFLFVAAKIWKICFVLPKSLFLRDGFKDFLKSRPHFGLIADGFSQFFQPRRVLRFGEPKAEISCVGILLQKVLAKALILSFFVKLWVMVETELDGASDDLFRRDKPVGFGHDFAVNGARLMS